MGEVRVRDCTATREHTRKGWRRRREAGEGRRRGRRKGGGGGGEREKEEGRRGYNTLLTWTSEVMDLILIGSNPASSIP